jgi:hypothetical protein
MTRIVSVFLVVMSLAHSVWAQYPPDVQSILERAAALGRDAQTLLEAPVPVASVPAGGNLQAALDAGPLVVKLSPGVYAGSFTIRRSGTSIEGNGAELRSTQGPALYVVPGVSNVQVNNIVAASTYQSVVQLGDNLARIIHE